jgi:GNAT superfamily N-acetyltransferase
MAAGGLAGIATAIPDLIALAGGVGSALFPGDKGRAEAFVDTVTGISEKFGSEFAINFATDLINKTDLSEDQRQMLADAFDVGTVAGLPFVPQAAKAVGRGIRNYAAGAPERVAERATGTTLTSGVDPTSLIDDVIVSAGRKSQTFLSDIERNVRSKFPNVDLDFYGDKDKGYTLSKIIVPKDERKQGLGEAVMNELIKQADNEGALIKLTPSTDFGATSTSRLKKFYKKFGFVENKGRNKDPKIRETMYRLPLDINSNKVIDDIITAQARYFETGNYEPPTKENPVSVVKPKEDEPGIIAFHGSGANFDEFRLEMIGTGEGAQAYGYGLYFTDNEDIANFYKNMMTRNVDIDGKPYIRGNKINDELVDPDIADDLGATNGDLEAAIKSSEEFLQEMVQADNVQAIRSTSKELEKLKQLRGRISINDEGGKTYKVGLAPKPDELLDYDLPLSQQPKKYKAALDEIAEIFGIPVVNQFGESASFGSFQDALKQRVESSIRNEMTQQRFIVDGKLEPVLADKNRDAIDRLILSKVPQGARLNTQNASKISSEVMQEFGIPGIKYFDNTSRNTAGGKLIDVTEAEDGFRAKVAVDNRRGGLGGSGRIVTTSPPYKTKQQALDWADEATKRSGRNYVIFDDKAIKILEKYGIAGPVAVTATAVGMKQEEQSNGNTS